MVVLTAVTAALYATAYVVLSPFSIDLVPGVLSFSIRGIFPLLLGILFGPAGAWGLGIGNLIGDLFTGSLAIGSVFGFAANFLLGFLGFMLWWRYGPSDEVKPETPPRDRARYVATYLVIGVIASGAAAVVLAWGLNLLGLAPFKIVAVTLFTNFIVGSWLGGLLYLALIARIRRMGLTWTEAMDVGAPPRRPALPSLAAGLVVIGGLGGWVTGLFVLRSDLTTAGVGAFFAAIVVGSLLL